MTIKETVVAHRVDPDFGKLELIETRTMASVDGGPMLPLVYRTWQGKIKDLNADILISSEDNPPVITDDDRKSFCEIVSNSGDFRKRVASSQFELAKEWAEEGGLDAPLDAASFADLLNIKGFTIDPGRLTVWLQETADIFTGHDLEVRIEKGKIIETCLSG